MPSAAEEKELYLLGVMHKYLKVTKTKHNEYSLIYMYQKYLVSYRNYLNNIWIT